MTRASVVLILCWFIAGSQAFAGDSAWPGKHPLSQDEVGEVLVSELRCGACHDGVPTATWGEKSAPDLSNVGGRVASTYLRRFLTSPETTHPGSTMPDLLTTKSPEERARIAEALTHFLVAQSKSKFLAAPAERADGPLGKTLFHTLGCVACHGPRDASLAVKPVRTVDLDDEDDETGSAQKKPQVKPHAIGLDHVATKYNLASLGEFLFQPLRVRSSGRMPDMKLTPAESQAIAAYLLGEKPQTFEPLTPQESLVAEGKKHYEQLQCAACHSIAGITPPPKRRSLHGANLTRGCLSTDAHDGVRYQLEPAQRDAIRAALQAESKPADSQAIVAKTLTAYRCLVCHARGEEGGVHPQHDPFFTGSDQKLGDDGRIPPPLTLVGAKLRSPWLKKVLFDGESIRHYMATRMPQYGAANLQHLPELLSRVDLLTGVDLQVPNPESRSKEEQERMKSMRAAGNQLLGDKGLNCIACHHFNGKASSGSPGIDLITSYARLQPAWFHDYLLNPGAFRPRTVMPTAWPDGIATHKTILDGDTHKQIEAIWFYLSLGTSAADPPGIRGVSTKLEVTDRTQIHRGRSRVAGYRGIAVGLPERLSYAFNAETGTMSALWKGDFVSVNWSGQGSGDFHPAGDAIMLPQDVSFARLADESSAWPKLPVMTKEARTNPEPLYPKNVGYQFQGYQLDDRFTPTFLYRLGDVAIEDRSEALDRDGSKSLRRVLQFTAPTSQTLWFRALVGEIEQESERVFRTKRLRIASSRGEVVRRPVADAPRQSELLLKLELTVGKSNLELRYDLLDK